MGIIRLTNFHDHPVDHRYMIFSFGDPKVAGEFMDELTMKAIPFEADNSGEVPYLIAVKKQFREQAVRANYTVLGRHREKFIGDDVFRWFLLILVGLVVLLAIAGALNRS